ncbi:MAG TPA: PEP-CTERM sorting domain-containing protein [Blastocatellia bacterium]|nr:PEP-CTERM sorting domain-containing protein [Blastocatellia bacterium]
MTLTAGSTATFSFSSGVIPQGGAQVLFSFDITGTRLSVNLTNTSAAGSAVIVTQLGFNFSAAPQVSHTLFVSYPSDSIFAIRSSSGTYPEGQITGLLLPGQSISVAFVLVAPQSGITIRGPSVSLSTEPVPEPNTMILLGTALAATAAGIRRRRSSQRQ